MDRVSDELLMAYADGELAPDERSRIEAEIELDKDLRARLSIFERTKTELPSLFDEPMRRPVPDRLVDAAFGIPSKADSGAKPSRERAASFGWFKSFLAQILPPARLAYAVPAMACVLLFAGGLSGWHLKSIGSLHPASRQQPLAVLQHGKVIAQAQLHQALEATASGQTLALSEQAGEPGVVKPQFTFRTADKQFSFRTEDKKVCRQYLLSQERQANYAGVACRESDGSWQVQIHVVAAGWAGRAATTGKFTPASGPKSDPIDEHVDRMIDGDVLGREEELELLKSWKAN